MATIMSRPAVSSPLAGNASSAHTQTAAQRVTAKRNPSFPSSRALRPFPSIAHAIQPSANNKKAVKIIEPPKHQKSMFMLNLTQAEFSRQDDD